MRRANVGGRPFSPTQRARLRTYTQRMVGRQYERNPAEMVRAPGMGMGMGMGVSQEPVRAARSATIMTA